MNKNASFSYSGFFVSCFVLFCLFCFVLFCFCFCLFIPPFLSLFHFHHALDKTNLKAETHVEPIFLRQYVVLYNIISLHFFTLPMQSLTSYGLYWVYKFNLTTQLVVNFKQTSVLAWSHRLTYSNTLNKSRIIVYRPQDNEHLLNCFQPFCRIFDYYLLIIILQIMATEVLINLLYHAFQ